MVGLLPEPGPIVVTFSTNIWLLTEPKNIIDNLAPSRKKNRRRLQLNEEVAG